MFFWQEMILVHRTIGMERGGTAASLLNQVSLTYLHKHKYIIMLLTGYKSRIALEICVYNHLLALGNSFGYLSLKFSTGYVAEDSPYTPNGQKGTYYFEFSRPLRTMDRLQQVI